MEGKNGKFLVREESVNRTEGYSGGDSGLFEPFTFDRGKLFRACQREHGRCTSKVYIDLSDGSALPIGWVFEKQACYEDTNESFLLETWVTLHRYKPTTVYYHLGEKVTITRERALAPPLSPGSV